ncbi:MAG TPA: hypothetical protein VFR15_19150 [Chloroflexia bacterium]|nr:hypothetical protein [Chloroflexia bacterium]
MAARVEAETKQLEVESRARTVWLVIAVAMAAFIVLCGLGVSAIAAFLSNITAANNAKADVVSGSGLIVHRRNSPVTEFVTGTTTLAEGDTIQTPAGGRAFVRLFDDSTVQTFFDTRVEFQKMRATQFFENAKDIALVLHEGTAVVATGILGAYSAMDYTIATSELEVQVQPNSRVRVRAEGSTLEGQVTRIVVDAGRATVLGRGQRIELGTAQMAILDAATDLRGPFVAELALVENGDFSQPPSPPEEVANGGLGTAGWSIIRDEDAPALPGARVSLASERIPNLGSVPYVLLANESSAEQYGRIGIRQEINEPAEYLNTIELTASIKLVNQAFPSSSGGGELYPLTIRVLYADSDGRTHEWRRSFYINGSDIDLSSVTATRVQSGAWQSTEQIRADRLSRVPPERQDLQELNRIIFVLKSPELTTGKDIFVINSIEVYGYGPQFRSWVTGISLVAR